MDSLKRDMDASGLIGGADRFQSQAFETVMGALERSGEGEAARRQEDLVALLVSINCIAAGLGWTA